MRTVDRLQFVNGCIAIGIFALAPLLVGGLPELNPVLRVVYWASVALIAVIFVLLVGSRRAFPARPALIAAGTLVVLSYVANALGSVYGFGIMLLALATAFWAFFVPFRVSVLTIVILLPLSTALAVWVNDQVSMESITVSTILTVLVLCFALITTTEVAVAERARDEAERATRALEAAREQLRQHGAVEERLRIARELHDIVGHQLAGLTLSLETARHLPPDEAQHYLDSAQMAGKELLAQVRAVVSELRDAPTEPVSLEQLSRAWPGMQVSLTEPQVVEELPLELRHATVRLVQEALTNAARHGGATQTWVALELSDGSLSVVVRDNGRGADAAVEGNGLRGMRERFDALDGSVVWRGMPTGGFVIQASAPVDPVEAPELTKDHS